MSYELDEVKKIFSDYVERMDKSIDSMKIEFQNIRAGRANPHILDKITVEAYGAPTPLNQIGNITVAEARVLIISVWDTSLLKAAEKAILAANIGLTPTNDGKILRLVFPELTGERRKELVKTVKTVGEATKVALRNERRDVLEGLKRFKKDNLITEDDQKTFEKDAEKLIAQKTEIVERLVKEKEDEIVSV
jgi:ribosome recycling factor